ncbi:MAG: protocatechuate 4,5-dioxygenase subunit alpha [Rhodobacteraceae bacterium]|nr:protocatechuate 4,5-dioxygenase subunit alpha [Paracoccaceae bacterium]
MSIEEFDHHTPIPGTTLFDGEMAMKGYALNKMCYSFNGAEARQEYLNDPMAYYAKFKLNAAQIQACENKNVLEMIAAGGNIYYLAKFAGIFKLSVQDIGAQQTGVTTEEFKENLLRQGD